MNIVANKDAFLINISKIPSFIIFNVMPKINNGSIGIKTFFNIKLLIFVINDTKFSIGIKLFL